MEPLALVFPVLVVLAGAAVSIVSARRRGKPLRETKYVAIYLVVTYSISNIWDTHHPTPPPLARVRVPTFTRHEPPGGELPPIAFEAIATVNACAA